VPSYLSVINRHLDRLIPVTTPLAVALGLFLPDVFINLRPFVIWLFGIITFSGALKLTARELTIAVRSPVSIVIFFVISHVIMPLAALFSSSLVFDNPDVIAGFVLLFAGPTAVSGFIWVAIFKGDKALSLSFILLDTMLAPFVVPFTISVLMGAKVSMDMSGIALSLLFMVVVPTIAGVALNEAGRRRKHPPDLQPELPQGTEPAFKISAALDPAAKICLMLVIAANSSAVAPNIKFNDPLVWKIALLCITLTASGFLLAKFSGFAGKLNEQKGISLILASGLRNNSAVMTIAVAFFPESAVLPAILSIIFQQTIAAIMGKLLIQKKEI